MSQNNSKTGKKVILGGGGPRIENHELAELHRLVGTMITKFPSTEWKRALCDVNVPVGLIRQSVPSPAAEDAVRFRLIFVNRHPIMIRSDVKKMFIMVDCSAEEVGLIMKAIPPLIGVLVLLMPITKHKCQEYLTSIWPDASGITSQDIASATL